MFFSKKSHYISLAVATMLCSSLLIGCGSSSHSSRTSSDNDTQETNDNVGTIVDPYIVGAILCEDQNKNNICDPTEQKSTPSDENGQFKFSQPLVANSHIIIAQQGTHNGITYDVNLVATVNSDGKIDVISPMTTLETKGLTTTQIATLLNNAGLQGIKSNDITADPMDGLSGKTDVTDAELLKLQSSLSLYGLLKIIKGSDRLNNLTSTELYNSTEIKNILNNMVGSIKTSLNATTFNSMKTNISNNNLPPVTTDVVIKTAVTIIDKIATVGYETCNATNGDVNLALQEVNKVKNDIINKSQDIGMYYYGLVNKEKLNNIPSNYLPDLVKQGINNTTGMLMLDDHNNFVTNHNTKLNEICNIVSINAGTLGDNKIEIKRIDNSINKLVISQNGQIKTAQIFPSNGIIEINPMIIGDGENKISLLDNNNNEQYFYIYKGRYDASEHSDAINGNTNYQFNNIRANGTIANDMFITVDNYNDLNTTFDDRWIYMLPDNNGNIAVNNLNASGGYRIDADLYETYVVANANGENGGQDVNLSSTIDIRLANNSSISGTFKKVDNTTGGAEVPFTSADATDNNIWIHAHYTNTNATYSSVCNGPKCTEPNDSGNVWVGAQDMHLENDFADGRTSYDFTTGEYSINHLATDTGYTLLVFWQAKNISGLSYDVNTTTGNNIVLSGESKDVNGTLSGSDDTLRIARVVTFSGQPNILYSQFATKDQNDNNFSINYQYDTNNTTTYLLWGSANDSLELNSTIQNDCNSTNKCIQIKIGGDDDNSTNLSL